MEQILTKTDGVPLFVEELTRSILESRDLRDAGDRYEYARAIHRISIPATLRDSLMARLDRSTPVKEIAQIGAAIGREFSHELIAAVAPLSQAAVDESLAGLTESGLALRRGTPPDATYTFKHALIQDAAYDSLLRSRRQELHGRIAWAIHERFPAIALNAPEILAHHYTQAGQTQPALPLWQKAGEVALTRMALAESIAHLNKGLELAATLPPSSERDASELALRVPLGTAWLAFRGWADPEVWNSLYPALALAKSLRRNDALLPIFVHLTSYVVSQGRVGDALDWANEALRTAKTTGDSDLLVCAHTLACTCCFWAGRLVEALEHNDRVWLLYEDDKHRHLASLLNHDPKTVSGIYASTAWWILGYPDRAVTLSDKRDAHARRLNHPFDLAYSLSLGSDVFNCRREPGVLHRRAEEVERLGREHSLPFLWAHFAPVRSGLALNHEGKAAQSVAALRNGLEVWEASGGKAYGPYLKAVVAEGLARLCDVEAALGLIDEQVDQLEDASRNERVYYAEVLRLKGWVLSLKDDLEGAEQSYRISLAWARKQGAKSWELRTATSLARLWQTRGKRREAHELLAPVYGWFTEGFDTKDLKEAKSLLGQLDDTA
jgi:tetratricopeptide (TPR) repeat protein